MAVTPFAMPSSSLLLLFSVVLGLSNADPFALPVQTAVYVADEWSPRPTGAPADAAALFKRGGSVDVAVCGWIGGESAKPLACAAGSSCIHDTIHGVIGCCTKEGPCTQGVHTACMDKNSAGWASTTGLVNNGVTTCAEDSQCYKITYPGNYAQYTCGDPKAPAQALTTFAGQPTDMRMQVVFTEVTFSPMPAAPSPSTLASVAGPSPTDTNAFSSDIGGAAGKVSPVSAATSESSSSSPNKGTSPGAVAGGTAGAVAGVTIMVLVGVWCWRRRQKKINAQSSGSVFEPTREAPFAAPFQPVQPYHNPDDMVSPMSGGPDPFSPISRRTDTGASAVNPFHYDTAYRSGGGMGVGMGMGNRPSFSTVAGMNPFADEVVPPLPQTGRERFMSERDISENRFYDNDPRFSDNHGYADNPSIHDDHVFADVAASNPFTDAQGYSTVPTSGHTLSPYGPPPRNQPSPGAASDQTQPLVDEIEDFSRSWQASAASHRDPNEHSDDEDASDHRCTIQTAMSVPVAHGNLIETQSNEQLRNMDHNPHASNAQTERSSLLGAQFTPTPLLPNAQTFQRAPSPNDGRAAFFTVQEKIQKLAQEKAQIVRKRAESQDEIKEEEENPAELKVGTQNERPLSGTSEYSNHTHFSRQDSIHSTRLHAPPNNIPKRMTSFGLNRAIKPALEEDFGGDNVWSSGWSGVGGGWLEGQSGRSSMITDIDGGDRGSRSVAAPTRVPTTITRKPVSISRQHQPAELRDSATGRKNTFGMI